MPKRFLPFLFALLASRAFAANVEAPVPSFKQAPFYNVIVQLGQDRIDALGSFGLREISRNIQDPAVWPHLELLQDRAIERMGYDDYAAAAKRLRDFKGEPAGFRQLSFEETLLRTAALDAERDAKRAALALLKSGDSRELGLLPIGHYMAARQLLERQAPFLEERHARSLKELKETARALMSRSFEFDDADFDGKIKEARTSSWTESYLPVEHLEQKGLKGLKPKRVPFTTLAPAPRDFDLNKAAKGRILDSEQYKSLMGRLDAAGQAGDYRDFRRHAAAIYRYFTASVSDDTAFAAANPKGPWATTVTDAYLRELRLAKTAVDALRKTHFPTLKIIREDDEPGIKSYRAALAGVREARIEKYYFGERSWPGARAVDTMLYRSSYSDDLPTYLEQANAYSTLLSQLRAWIAHAASNPDPAHLPDVKRQIRDGGWEASSGREVDPLARIAAFAHDLRNGAVRRLAYRAAVFALSVAGAVASFMAEERAWTLAGIALALIALFQALAGYANRTAIKLFDRARAEKLPELEKELAD
jgi:hypothetical protein